jgi:hypothetical protein
LENLVATERIALSSLDAIELTASQRPIVRIPQLFICLFHTLMVIRGVEPEEEDEVTAFDVFARVAHAPSADGNGTRRNWRTNVMTTVARPGFSENIGDVSKSEPARMPSNRIPASTSIAQKSSPASVIFPMLANKKAEQRRPVIRH